MDSSSSSIIPLPLRSCALNTVSASFPIKSAIKAVSPTKVMSKADDLLSGTPPPNFADASVAKFNQTAASPSSLASPSLFKSMVR